MQRAETDSPWWGQGAVRPQAGEIWVARRGRGTVEFRVTVVSENGRVVSGMTVGREPQAIDVTARQVLRKAGS